MIFRRRWLSRIDVPRIEAALRAAERRTSGELRVSVAPFFWGSIERAARRAFVRLGMTGTRQRNGVLFFVVPARRRFTVIGDEGIHARVGQAFWDDTARLLATHFSRGDFTGGLVAAIALVGDRLAEHFPWTPGDVNELPDSVDFGEPRR